MIKVVAVDMDGTFLNPDNDYDRQKFEVIFSKLEEKGIKFIVASGNQYYQIRSFFPNKDNKIIYLSENGAIVTINKKMKPVQEFSKQLTLSIIEQLQKQQIDLEFVLCGVDSAYLLSNSQTEFKDFAKKYYYELKEVDSFDELPNDVFVKFALEVAPEKVNQVVSLINDGFTGEVEAVSSGHGSIDIILPGVTKGDTLLKLFKEWKIEPDELMAFGDSNNDLEMLKLTENSYAMGNANAQVKAVAKHLAPSNSDSGVLQVIEKNLTFEPKMLK